MVIGVICYVLAVERVRLVDEEGDNERDEVHRHVERRHTHELQLGKCHHDLCEE